MSDIPGFMSDHFGGEFWDVPENYIKRSPIFHVKNVSPPTLIQHGEADVRIPIGQGYEFYYALKTRSVPSGLWFCRVSLTRRTSPNAGGSDAGES